MRRSSTARRLDRCGAALGRAERPRRRRPTTAERDRRRPRPVEASRRSGCAGRDRARRGSTSAERLHEVRIAVKQLRYALEVYASCAGPRPRPGSRSSERIQDLLGAPTTCTCWPSASAACRSSVVGSVQEHGPELGRLVRALDVDCRASSTAAFMSRRDGAPHAVRCDRGRPGAARRRSRGLTPDADLAGTVSGSSRGGGGARSELPGRPRAAADRRGRLEVAAVGGRPARNGTSSSTWSSRARSGGPSRPPRFWRPALRPQAAPGQRRRAHARAHDRRGPRGDRQAHHRRTRCLAHRRWSATNPISGELAARLLGARASSSSRRARCAASTSTGRCPAAPASCAGSCRRVCFGISLREAGARRHQPHLGRQPSDAGGSAEVDAARGALAAGGFDADVSWSRPVRATPPKPRAGPAPTARNWSWRGAATAP